MKALLNWFNRISITKQQRNIVLCDVFKTPSGRLALAEIIVRARLDADPFLLAQGDLNKLAYFAGRQSMAKELLHAINLTEQEIQFNGADNREPISF